MNPMNLIPEQKKDGKGTKEQKVVNSVKNGAIVLAIGLVAAIVLAAIPTAKNLMTKAEMKKVEKNIQRLEDAGVEAVYEEYVSVKQLSERLDCEANLYQREVELEKLEADHGNKLAERIYSLKIGHKYQFLSIDKQHGMLELCDDKGDHQMEIRFDGTKNKDREVDHSLKCVKEWKKKHNK